MENEIWKAIPQFEGLYEVSNLGRVRNNKRLILKQDCVKGYYRVRLYANNEYHRILTHRVVGMAFIPNPLNLPQINHKNEIKTDNRVENLEWCTREYNYNYGTGQVRARKNRCKKIAQYTKSGELIRIWDSIKSATEVFGCSIKGVLLNYKWHKSAYGYIWKYV